MLMCSLFIKRHQNAIFLYCEVLDQTFLNLLFLLLCSSYICLSIILYFFLPFPSISTIHFCLFVPLYLLPCFHFVYSLCLYFLLTFQRSMSSILRISSPFCACTSLSLYIYIIVYNFPSLSLYILPFPFLKFMFSICFTTGYNKDNWARHVC